jgi:hypothetical protein
MVSGSVGNIFINRDEVIKNLLTNLIDSGDKLGKIIIRKEDYWLYPIMVWKPCKEIRSPY